MSSAFLYGAARIAQQGAGGREYFLGDAINSARQLVNAAGRVGPGRGYEPFGDLLSIAGEIQTAYGFAGEWADATGLINRRARYYQPTTGRFVQPDPFEGFPTRPISVNAYLYAYDNPLIYTDASGRNPVLALIAGIAGGMALGGLAGGAFGLLTYDWALSGQCGCDMQQAAKSMPRWDWIGTNALSGGILGGAAIVVSGLVAGLGPGALIAVGGLGLVVSVRDFVATVDMILNETGLTTCTAIRLLIDVAGIVLSTVGIVQGVRAWQASGSLVSWAPSTANALIQRTQLELEDLARQAIAEAGEGSGHAYRSRVHGVFRRLVRGSGDAMLWSEVGYRAGLVVETPYGPGTSAIARVDVVLGDREAPIAIFDLKTGTAFLSEARISTIRANLPRGYTNIPIIEINP